MSVVKFETTKIDFGQVNQSDVLDFEFPFEGNPDDIDYVAGGCPSCTQVWVEGNSVKGKLTVANTQTFRPGNNVIMKSAKVFLDPDQPEFVPDERKVRVGNDLKRIIVLNLRGNVQIEEPKK